MITHRVEILLADADVLIDYRDSDLTVLKLVSEHIGPVRVLREVLDEAPGIDDSQCAQLGIQIVRLETELMIEANDLPRSLSAEDRFCIIACERNRWTLVTNDRAMRTVGKQRGIQLRWGLGLMVDLVHAQVITEPRAIKVATAIRAANPTHITADLFERFRTRLRER